MNDTANSTATSGLANTSSPINQPGANGIARQLRCWPAVILVALMAILHYLPNMIEGAGIEVIMLAMMGPAALGVLILVWWLALSRAPWRERLIGFSGVLLLAIVASVGLHKSLQGMGVMLFVIPAGTIAFALAITILARKPAIRLPMALLSALAGFGVWDLLQSEGVSGKFVSSFDWRWNKSSEEKYVESLAKQSPHNPPTQDGDSPAITLASSAWSAFRGPARDGKLLGVSLSEDWTASPPKKLWMTNIGPGWSSFAVAGNRLFTQEQRGEMEAVVCLDADNGSVVWMHEYQSRFWEALAGAGPRATPTIADEGLFATGADGIVSCLNANTGKEIWHIDLKEDAFRDPPMWGFCSSPLVVDGLAIVHAGGKGDFGIFAYDAKTGEQRWSAPSGDHSYSSPQLASFDGVRGVLMLTNQGLQFLNVADGSKIWDYEWRIENYRAIQPLVLGNSVLVANSLGGGVRRITATLEGKQWSLKEEWSSKDMKPDFNDYVEHQGNLYGFDGNIFGCIDLKDGKRKWKKGRYGNGQVLLLCDAGQMLVTTEKGEIVLLKADAEKMVELAKFQAIEGKTWNHPVVVGNRIYLRNAEQAACFELPNK